VFTLLGSRLIGRLTDQIGKLIVYRFIAPISAFLLIAITHLHHFPNMTVEIAVVLFGAMMVSNVGRMIAAMAIITGGVEPQRRGGFLSANSSVQHIASGFGAYLGGIIIQETADKQLANFGIVGWIAAASTFVSLWLAGRVRSLDQRVPSAESMSLAAAAEASVDASEPMLDFAEKI
jgi:predicted MFS family arabinose efflux permease